MIKKPWSWVVVTTRLAYVDRNDGKRLFLTIAKSIEGGWFVASAETLQSAETVDDFFDKHAHKAVGTYPTLHKARVSAISFGKMWMKNAKVSRAKDCPCDTIKLPRTKHQKRSKSSTKKNEPFMMTVPT